MPDEPTPQQLGALLRLQEQDTTLRRLEHQLDNLPEQQALDEAEREAAGVRQRADDVRVDLDLVASRSRKLEGDIDLLRQRREDDQTRMYGGQISNPRELQALRADIESTERRITEHEDDLLEVMEERERLQGDLEKLEARQHELDEEVRVRTAARDEAAGELVAQLEQARAERDRARAELPDDLLEAYDRLRDRRGGIAVGQLEHGMCTACRIELPRIDVSELRGGPALATCPECERLLVVRT